MVFSSHEISRAKSFMHAEEEDNETISEFLEMAAEYLRESGIEKTPSNVARYKIALRSIALHFYDNRDPGDNVPGIPNNTQRLINQLKPYP